MSSLPEIEVGEDPKDETIKALKDHIDTLKAELFRLRSKYEPEESQPAQVNVKLPLKPAIRTTAALIEALERRSRLEVEKNEEL